MDAKTLSRLEAVYAKVPQVHCQRKCEMYCGPLLVPRIEHERIEEKVGYLPKTDVSNIEIFHKTIKKYGDEMVATVPEKDLKCRLLMPVIASCRVYAVRPLICRAWGAIDSPEMRCPFGCKPDRLLSEEEFSVLLKEVIHIQQTQGE